MTTAAPRALTLTPDPVAPGQARRFVAAALAGGPHAALVDVAQLLVSELVTNAVVHAASEVEVEVLADPAGVTVRVRDADTGPLVAQGGGAEFDEGGRGFVLVDRLADAWGTEHRHGRKVVWFRVNANASADARDAAATAPLSGRPPAGSAELTRTSTSEQRLRTLLLRPSLRRELTFNEHLAELLSRIVDAVGADGADVLLAAGSEPAVRQGRVAPEPRSVHELLAGDRSLGALRVYSEHDFDDDADAFLRLAADRLTLLAAEHGVAMAQQERVAELDYLAEATELLAGSLSVSLSLTLVTQIVVPRLADWCAVYGVDDRGRPRRLMATHRREDRTDAVTALLDSDRELRDAVRDAAQGRAAKRLPAAMSVGGQRSNVAVVPLTSRGRTLGVLVLGRPTPFDAVGFMAVLELGRRAALAVDNARLHEEQVETAQALQTSLLPSALPPIDGVQVAARYHSASPGMLVGGDFYDAFPLPDGSVVLAIGDVCGKGAEAAAVTGMSRDLLRLLLQDGRDPASALRRLNRALIDHPNSSRFCTIALARLSPAGDTGLSAQICLAGHPEPVVLRADGTTELAGTPGDLLGVVDDADLQVTESRVPLGPGDSLVLYTDGITERRDGRRMYGQVGLRKTLEQFTGADAETLAHEIESATQSFVDTELRDDLAILVVQCAAR